jgi:hypothetical protein
MMVVLCVFFYSCVLEKPIRKEITVKHPEVKTVDILNKYGGQFDLDIAFHDGRRLVLSGMGKDLAPGSIVRIGNYTYEVFMTNKGRVRVEGGYSNGGTSVYLIAAATGLSIETVHDVIRWYDRIYEYTAGLPDIDDGEIKAERDRMLKIARIPYRWIWFSEMEFDKVCMGEHMYILFRKDWDDSFPVKAPCKAL